MFIAYKYFHYKILFNCTEKKTLSEVSLLLAKSVFLKEPLFFLENLMVPYTLQKDDAFASEIDILQLVKKIPDLLL